MTAVMPEALRELAHAALSKVGADSFTADAVATGLCEASLRGVDSHGIRLLPHYVSSARSGRKNPRPEFRIARPFPACAVLDADGGFGHAAGFRAIDLGCEVAAEQGLAAIWVVRSSHPGMLASYVLRAARRGFVAFAFTHADALMRSHGGERAFFGTNPLAMAAPCARGGPFCIDLATTQVTWNRVLMHRAEGAPLPAGVAADAEGHPTRDPDEARSLLPAGEHKGFALAAMIEVLCGVMTGMAFGPHLPGMYTSPMDRPRDLGQLYLVMRGDACMATEQLAERVAEMSEELRAEPGSVQTPGDPERIAADRRRKGIPLDAPTAETLLRLARELEIDWAGP